MAKVVVELGGEWLWNGHGIFRKVHDSYDETAFYENIPDVHDSFGENGVLYWQPAIFDPAVFLAMRSSESGGM